MCGAEALSRITDHTDRGTAILFADGAGAVVVAGGDLDRGLSTFELRSDGRHSDLLYVDMRRAAAADGGPRGLPPRRRAHGRGDDGRARSAPASASTTSTASSPTRPTPRIIEAAARRLGVPEEKVIINVDTVANTSSASIPIALWQAEREGKLKPGDVVAMATFGAGFAWGAGVMSWKERVHATA